MSREPVVLTVYSRPGCHLCDEALAELDGLRAEMPGIAIDVIDIDSDDELLKRHLERIPVVEVDGVEVSELVLDLDAVRARIPMP